MARAVNINTYDSCATKETDKKKKILMNIKDIHKVYFLGIGGIGMSALARYFCAIGKSVSGYDRTATPLTKQLQKEGFSIHFNDDVSEIPIEISTDKENTLIIYTPAIPNTHKELQFLKNEGFTLKKRSEVLGIITKEKKAVAIAGTHGKTTVSSIIAHILKNSNIDCSAFLGGIAKNFNSNLLISEKSEYVVVEADEFDRSFLQLNPYIAIITVIDADHLDIYNNKETLEDAFKEFISQIKPGGTLFIKKGIEFNYELPKDVNVCEYSIEKNSDSYAENVRFITGKYIIDIKTPFGDLKDIKIGMPGLINVENSLAAISVAKLLGVDNEDIKTSMQNFEGIKRRFDLQVNTEKYIYIDDYAHHPEEIKKTVLSAKDMFPNKKLTGVFQPHLFTRTRDFAVGFAESLSLLDEIIITDIYPARELPIEGVSSEIIFNKINNPNKLLCKKEEVVDILHDKKLEVLLTMGAGDIDQLTEPIKEMILQKKEEVQ